MMNDLYSVSPLRYRDQEETGNQQQQQLVNKGILRNMTNNTLDLQPKPDPLAAIPQKPIKNVNELQNYVVKQAVTNARQRSASVNSRKSVGDATTDDERNPKATSGKLLSNNRTVAFGRTTNVDDTIKGIRAPVNFRPPIGSTKDIMDLRKTVENQTLQIQAQNVEIDKLKEVIQKQHENYCYLLDSNAKLWDYVNNLGKLGSSANSSDKAKFENARVAAITKEYAIVSNTVKSSQPLDSFAVKKYKENRNVEVEKPQKKNAVVEERQLVPASPKPIEAEPQSFSALSGIQRFIDKNPNCAKDLEKIIKNVQKNQRNSDSDKNEDEQQRDVGRQHRRQREHKKDHRYDYRGHGYGEVESSVVEKFTMERRIIHQPRNIREELSSTIDDTLGKLNINLSPKRGNRNHQQQRRLPPTPTIRPVTSSSSSSFSSEDDYVENSNLYSESPVNNRRRREREDEETSALGRCTEMPDFFGQPSSDCKFLRLKGCF
jgi:hypothetical protein